MSEAHVKQARKPSEFGWKDWWGILKSVWQQFVEDRLQLIAAGVAFYFLLALFPMITALVSIYGMTIGPFEFEQHLERMQGLVPPSLLDTMAEFIGDLVEKSDTALGVGAIIASLVAVWSGSKGIQALITACNVAYREDNSRPWWKQILLRLAFTFGALLMVIAALLFITVFPVWFKMLGLGWILDVILPLIVWPMSAVVFCLAIMLLYRFAADRRSAQWRWLRVGTITATLLWMLASVLFSFYVSNFSSYSQSYGSLAGVVIALMWFYLTAITIILGATLNSAIEHHTTVDTTVGERRPRGERGAVVADTLPSDSEKT